MDVGRIIAWGTADVGKPRTRILIEGLRSQNVLVEEALVDIWGGVEDKSQIRGLTRYMYLAFRFLTAYPILIWKYLRAPRHNAVFIGYMGHFDVLILWPFAKLRGAKIIWDAFLSLYDTVIDDRKMASPKSALARIIKLLEKLSCRAADIIFLDTIAHAEYFQRQYKTPPEKIRSVWVGAETNIFSPSRLMRREKEQKKFTILFYGQFIPLHGVEFIVDAARRVNDSSIAWTLIGKGQEAAKIKRLINKSNIPSLKLIDWLDYDALPQMIANADLCLGVFGKSDKASRVIPNKVFQVLAMGRPLVTMDGPAIREILSPETPGVWLVEPGSGEAIAEAVIAARQWAEQFEPACLHSDIRGQITPEAISEAFMAQLCKAV